MLPQECFPVLGGSTGPGRDNLLHQRFRRDRYDTTIGAMHRRVRASTAGAAGDPLRGAEIIVQAVKRDNPPSHLLLGATAAEMAIDYSRRQIAEAAAWHDVSRSADYAQPYPAQYPPDKPCT